MSSSPQVTVFVPPTQSINVLLEAQHTTTVIITMMMYSLLCGGLKEAVTAWDSSAESEEAKDTASGVRGMIVCNAGIPQRWTKKTFQ